MGTRSLKALSSAGLLCATGAFAADTPQACESTVSGDLRLHTLDSKVFGNSRTIRVLLPPGYDAPGNRSRRYPVLYLLDGQNRFDACLSDMSHHEWGVDETVYDLVGAQKIPPLIVVGVDHAGKFRAHEYLPYKDFLGNGEMDAPAGQRFPEFLTREVEANFHAAGYDEKNFRVVVEPEALHTETAWAGRLPGALTFLFGEWRETAPPPAR